MTNRQSAIYQLVIWNFAICFMDLLRRLFYVLLPKYLWLSVDSHDSMSVVWLSTVSLSSVDSQSSIGRQDTTNYQTVRSSDQSFFMVYTQSFLMPKTYKGKQSRFILEWKTIRVNIRTSYIGNRLCWHIHVHHN